MKQRLESSTAVTFNNFLVVVMALKFLSALGFLVIISSVAQALDCIKASTPVDKMICSHPELKKADEEMSAAYFKLLHETKDPEFHEILIRSQRRWLQVRSEGPDAYRFGDDKGDENDNLKVLLGITQVRLDLLQRGWPIHAMEQQRKITSKDSGGAFAGFRTVSCTLVAPPFGHWNYECLGTQHRQHRDRVCSSSTEWASGHTSEKRYVSVVKDGKLNLLATCETGYNYPELNENWDTTPAHNTSTPDADKLWKYDPDLDLVEDDPQWMRDCLFSATYPLPEKSHSDPANKQ